MTLRRVRAVRGNRDFVLRYRLAGDEIASGLLLYPGADENFFLLMVQPPRPSPPDEIPPREYIFVLDVSGSMHGFPLDTAKTLMRDLRACCARPTRSTSCCSPRLRDVLARVGSGDAGRISRARCSSSTGSTAAAAPSCSPRSSARWRCRASGRVAQRRRRHRRLHRGRGGRVRVHPRAPRRGQRLRVRHRQQRQPAPHRGHGARRAGRAVRRHGPGEAAEAAARFGATSRRRC